MEILMWFSVFAIIYAYVGYPASLYLLARWKGKKFKHDYQFTPPISIIIAAADEEGKIKQKLLNTLNLSYPYGLVEYIVTLDGSTDNTAKIVEDMIKEMPHRGISLIWNGKGGKEAAQLAAVKQAKGNILIFTDVATVLTEKTLLQLVSNFADERVGAVDGMSMITKEGSNEGLYLKYENKIREYESQLGSLVTLGGCLFAVRRDIVQNEFRVNGKVVPGFRPDRQSDFRTALVTKVAGKQAILDKSAIAYFDDIEDPSREFGRKHRTIVRGFANFFNHLYLLNPRKYGLFSYQLFCHKMMKWLVPFFMIGAFVGNVGAVLTTAGGIHVAFYTLTLFGQLVFYAIAELTYKDALKKFQSVAKIIFFFVMTNLAMLKAWFSYIKGERYVMWTPTKR